MHWSAPSAVHTQVSLQSARLHSCYKARRQPRFAPIARTAKCITEKRYNHCDPV